MIPDHLRMRAPTAARRQSLAVRLLVSLFRRFPPHPDELIFRESAPRPAREYDQEVHLPFYRWFNFGPEMFRSKDVLDLGSGFGGHTVRYAEYGARSVVGVEIEQSMADHAAAFARERGVDNVEFRVGMGERLPCEDESIDLILMSDVLEHVINPRDVLYECRRVLRPGGRLALIFPPYYDITSGSHMHGRVTWLPGLHLLFPTRTLKSAMLIRLQEQAIDYTKHFRDVPTDKMWNLNGLTVGRFNELVREVGFSPETLEHVPHFQARARPIAFLARLAARTPLIREAFTTRIIAVLCK